jgi:hypothetical protein
VSACSPVEPIADVEPREIGGRATGRPAGSDSLPTTVGRAATSVHKIVAVL